MNRKKRIVKIQKPRDGYFIRRRAKYLNYGVSWESALLLFLIIAICFHDNYQNPIGNYRIGVGVVKKWILFHQRDYTLRQSCTRFIRWTVDQACEQCCHVSEFFHHLSQNDCWVLVESQKTVLSSWTNFLSLLNFLPKYWFFRLAFLYYKTEIF